MASTAARSGGGASSYLLVADYDGSRVLRYDAATGAFAGELISHKSGGLNQPQGMVIGPDGYVYVACGEVYGGGNVKAVLRFNAVTGEFVGNFTGSDHLVGPHAVLFGPDGNLYVSDGGLGTGAPHVAKFDGRTGAYLGELVPPGTAGQTAPFGMVFGPGHRGVKYDLYVSSFANGSVQRYDGLTGKPMGSFVAGGSGGLAYPIGLTFGPDGNLYVASMGSWAGASDCIMRFDGQTGAPMPSLGNAGAVFIEAGSGGLLSPFGTPIFGPDGNGDGRQDLYVPSFQFDGSNKSKAKTASVKCFDGISGEYIDDFVGVNSGGLDQPNYLSFTKTNPMTLAYEGP
jgi:hypothetical protein